MATSPTTSKAPEQAKAPEPTKAADASAEVKEGSKARLRAVYGLLINPNNEIRFTQEDSKLVVVDTWTMIQVAAGKLAVSDE